MAVKLTNKEKTNIGSPRRLPTELEKDSDNPLTGANTEASLDKALTNWLATHHDDRREIAKHLVRLARGGNLAAIKEVFERVDGKPVERRLNDNRQSITLIFRPFDAQTNLPPALESTIEGEVREIDSEPAYALDKVATEEAVENNYKLLANAILGGAGSREQAVKEVEDRIKKLLPVKKEK